MFQNFKILLKKNKIIAIIKEFFREVVVKLHFMLIKIIQLIIDLQTVNLIYEKNNKFCLLHIIKIFLVRNRMNKKIKV